MAIDRALHAVTWACWVATVLVVLSVTRNPIYVSLTLLWIGLVWLAVAVLGVYYQIRSNRVYAFTADDYAMGWGQPN